MREGIKLNVPALVAGGFEETGVEALSPDETERVVEIGPDAVGGGEEGDIPSGDEPGCGGGEKSDEGRGRPEPVADVGGGFELAGEGEEVEDCGEDVEGGSGAEFSAEVIAGAHKEDEGMCEKDGCLKLEAGGGGEAETIGPGGPAKDQQQGSEDKELPGGVAGTAGAEDGNGGGEKEDRDEVAELAAERN